MPIKAFVTVSRNLESCQALKRSLEDLYDRYTWHQIESTDSAHLATYAPESGRFYPSPQLHCMDGSCLDIFQGYDTAWKSAKGSPDDWWCFIHDDATIECRTSWLERLLTNKPLTTPTCGIVGVAGSRHMIANSTWWAAKNHECRGYVMHENKSSPFGVHGNVWPHIVAQFGPVIGVDGVMMLIRRRVLERLGGFATPGMSGFHFYDASISLRAHLAGFTNYVAPIPILHRSPGNTNESYEVARKAFLAVMGPKLPCRLDG